MKTTKNYLSRIALCALLLAGVIASHAKPPPLSIDELRSARTLTPLNFVRDLDDGPGFSSYLVSYQSGGLTVHAMVAVPLSAAPARGFPVIVANHGFHPNPAQYGMEGFKLTDTMFQHSKRLFALVPSSILFQS
jgi:hypothetical protein